MAGRRRGGIPLPEETARLLLEPDGRVLVAAKAGFFRLVGDPLYFDKVKEEKRGSPAEQDNSSDSTSDSPSTEDTTGGKAALDPEPARRKAARTPHPPRGGAFRPRARTGRGRARNPSTSRTREGKNQRKRKQRKKSRVEKNQVTSHKRREQPRKASPRPPPTKQKRLHLLRLLPSSSST